MICIRSVSLSAQQNRLLMARQVLRLLETWLTETDGPTTFIHLLLAPSMKGSSKFSSRSLLVLNHLEVSATHACGGDEIAHHHHRNQNIFTFLPHSWNVEGHQNLERADRRYFIDNKTSFVTRKSRGNFFRMASRLAHFTVCTISFAMLNNAHFTQIIVLLLKVILYAYN